MKVILYMATSINGKTTGINDNTDWVEESDVQRMDSLMKKCGVMLMGTGTYYLEMTCLLKMHGWWS